MSSRRVLPARQPSLREHNLALVLGEVARVGSVSRARIAAATGLTKATVSTLVDALMVGGLLRELGPRGVTGVGRPGSALALADGPVGIGLEINVDYLATCTVDLSGTVRRRDLVAEDLRGIALEAVLTRAAAVLSAALDDAARRSPVAPEGAARRSAVAPDDAARHRSVAQDAPVTGVVVAVPGLVERAAGLVRVAPNLGWRDVPLLTELRRRVPLDGVEVRLDNEANLAAWGEVWGGRPARGDGARPDSFLLVSGEIGVGAAIVVDGEIFTGTRGFGGEIGHLPLDPDGPPCRCGSRGCLEQYAGQEAILRRAGVSEPPGTTTGRPAGPVGRLVEALTEGDARATAAVADAARALGAGIAVAINLVDVDTVVLGGLYAVLARWLLDPVRECLDERVLAARWAPVRVMVSEWGGDGALRGAALAAVRSVIAEPAGWLSARAGPTTCPIG